MSAVVGFDARMYRHSGIGTYIRGILGHWPKVERNYRLKLFAPESIDGFETEAFASPIYSIGEQMAYGGALKKCDLWHAPHYNVPFFRGDTKLVVTIHDLIHWLFRKNYFSALQGFYAGTMLKRALTADHIITVSESTKQDLMSCFGADENKISVIYEGVSSRFNVRASEQDLEVTRQKLNVPRKYFLYVGLLKPHKQVHLLIDWFREMRKDSRTEAKLVIVGKRDASYGEGLENLANLRTDEDLIYLSEIEGDDLLNLYQGAIALTHPSAYEGFGLTLLEAMASKIPFVAFRAASIPEVAGDAGILVKDRDGKAFLDAMEELENNSAKRSDLIKAGDEQLKKFKWSQAAEQTEEVYRKVLES